MRWKLILFKVLEIGKKVYRLDHKLEPNLMTEKSGLSGE